MDDAAASSMLKPAGDRPRHTLTVPQVAQQLSTAGVPRSERRVAYFCQTKVLDADKYPSPTGPQWYVNPDSVPGLIGDLKQFDEQKRRRSQHAAAGTDSLKEPLEPDTAAAGLSTLEQAATELHNRNKPGLSQHAAADQQQAAAAYVSQLEKRIEEKNGEITFLRTELAQRNEEIVRRNERERETNILIRGLQNLVLQLQPGRPRSDVFENDPVMRPGAGTRDYPHTDAAAPSQ